MTALASMDEERRLEALNRYEVWETLPEEAFDRVARLAAELADAPIAMISFVGADRQWAKACYGMLSLEAPRGEAFCTWTIRSPAVLVVQDTLRDENFASLPLVTGAPHVRAYAGAPLVTPDGFTIGSLCIIDDRPRDFSESVRRHLTLLSKVVVDQLEARLEGRRLARSTAFAQALLTISALGAEDVAPTELVRRAVEVVARVADVDWSSLITIEGENVSGFTVRSTPNVPPIFENFAQAEVVHGWHAAWSSHGPHEFEYVDDYAAHPEVRRRLLNVGLRTVMWGALGHFEHTRYLLVAARFHVPRPWTEPERQLWGAVARVVTSSLERRAYLFALREAALTDTLTGLGNRRAFDLDLDATLARAHRANSTFSVGILDLDGLKAINDQEGHERGDALLRTFAASLRSELRMADRIYRLGGDEYALLLEHPDARYPPDELRDIMLSRVECAARRTRRSGFPAAGASLGTALFPHDAQSGADLVRLADARMYERKRLRKDFGDDFVVREIDWDS
ncbi:sensor domain-containing diguanylate cyclase [Deinococcus yavapaiensis]|uniref:Diguanylate cyclase with GAF sensor n=1 Tax=Deinococcus yavapaiensis KR-236 TaxID=694435 RepID=A0A318S6W8_9DEIO|nr:sensor domain-containing diguanylate cyclase [Deinococcus yavapaiensis]PYE53505.1 diguanylate cyclase with GAF sensor [Deinococcus yavapaiensis KR-236]